jgi:hypothetical protein
VEQSAKPTRHNRPITGEFQEPSPSLPLMNDGKALVACVFALLLALGLQLAHKATCLGGGCLPRHAHDARIRLGGLTLWRRQCPSCTAVLTVLPHCVWRSRRMRPAVARHALIATHGGLRLAWCATLFPIATLAL